MCHAESLGLFTALYISHVVSNLEPLRQSERDMYLVAMKILFFSPRLLILSRIPWSEFDLIDLEKNASEKNTK